jgi:3-deoxy-D-manno-octulosonic-acid transferase
MVLASARISPRTAARYQRLAALFRGSLPKTFIAAQTMDDADRLRGLGAEGSRLIVAGNLKFDIEVPPEVFDKGLAWRDEYASIRLVWTAGSTHEGEEAQVLAAHRDLLSYYPDALLVLAPRHPQRFEKVRALLARRTFAFAARSKQEPVTEDTQVLLLDTLGELTQFYAASDVVFVGGSLVPVGGHNLLEPAALALPILSGPSVFNAQEIAQQFFESGAARQVGSVRELAAAVRELFRYDNKRRAMGNKALEIVARNRGALNRVLQTIERALAGSKANVAD